MSTEAERITTTGERAPGGVPNLNPAQYTLACRPEMWAFAEVALDAIDNGKDMGNGAPNVFFPHLEAMAASRLVKVRVHTGNALFFSWFPIARVWCLTALAIKAQHVAGIARNPAMKDKPCSI